MAKECGSKFGCFEFPQGCEESQCTFIYKWSTNQEDSLSNDFVISAKITEIPSDVSWVAIGFSKDNQMGDDDVVLCKNSPNEKSISHYYNTDKIEPRLLDLNNVTIGLSKSSIDLKNGFLICSFTREKQFHIKNYFNLNKSFFILAAYGPYLLICCQL